MSIGQDSYLRTLQQKIETLLVDSDIRVMLRENPDPALEDQTIKELNEFLKQSTDTLKIKQIIDSKEFHSLMQQSFRETDIGASSNFNSPLN